MKIPSSKPILVAMAVFGLACSNSKQKSFDAGGETGSATGTVDGSGSGAGEEAGAVLDGAEDSRELLDGPLVGGEDGRNGSAASLDTAEDGSTGSTSDGPVPSSAEDASVANADAVDAADDDSGHADVVTGATCASGCQIAGACYQNSASNPNNPCLQCDVRRSATGWSANDGATCDDGLFCTVADKCSAGECRGFVRDCSDGVACNGMETCDELSNTCVPGLNACTGNTICESRTGRCVTNCPGCAIGGTCYSDGQVNPANPCQKCSRALKTSGWSHNDGATCDDNLFCTVGDKCAAGTCAGTARNCADGIACNGSETCDEANDACLAGTPTCAEDQVCNATSGQCIPISTTLCPGCLINGTCFGEGQSNPSNPCQKCARATSDSTWSDNDGALCDDGQFCSVGDECAAGNCAGTNRNCSDGIACNGTETCDEDADACLAGTTTCTEGQVCDVKTGGCVAISTCPGCVIDGTCFGEGQTDPNNPCQECKKSQSATTWGPKLDNTACDDDIFCNGADSCQGGHCTTHAGSPCAGGTTCIEDRNACYLVGVAMCNSAGNVVRYNDSGNADTVQTCVSPAAHGACSHGVCGCEAGYTGDDCHPLSASCIVYVSNAGSDSRGGTSWSDAVATVRKGLELAAAPVNADGGVSNCEVWVAGGFYSPGSTPSDTILLKSGVALYGGFAGGETARSQRNVAGNVTYLLGANKNYHVVTGVTGATIDGFTISGGNANGTGDDSHGGGMLNLGASPTVSNCTFSANSATDGGGMFNGTGSAPTITNCTFSANSAANSGGGISLHSSSPSLANCTFSGNTAQDGGGMFNGTSSSPTITNCSFSANSAKNGGGMYVHTSTPTVTNSIFWNDTADGDGPEFHEEASTMSLSYSLVQGGYASGTNILTGNPLFVGGAANMRLTEASPAIDQGTGCGTVPSTDKDGKPRWDITSVTNPEVTSGVYTSGVDIGAYEYQGGASDSTVTTLCPVH